MMRVLNGNGIVALPAQSIIYQNGRRDGTKVITLGHHRAGLFALPRLGLE